MALQYIFQTGKLDFVFTYFNRVIPEFIGIRRTGEKSFKKLKFKNTSKGDELLEKTLNLYKERFKLDWKNAKIINIDYDTAIYRQMNLRLRARSSFKSDTQKDLRLDTLNNN